MVLIARGFNVRCGRPAGRHCLRAGVLRVASRSLLPKVHRPSGKGGPRSTQMQDCVDLGPWIRRGFSLSPSALFAAILHSGGERPRL